jgi:hypothetical protein
MWHHEESAGKHSEGSKFLTKEIAKLTWLRGRSGLLSNKTDCNARSKSYGNLIQKTQVSMECLNRELDTTLDKSLSSKVEKVLEKMTKLIIS